MIAVIGTLSGRVVNGVVLAAGSASRIALAAARAGRLVQVVGKTGDDPTADGLLLDLARAGVGHVALLRDPARATPLEVSTDPDDEDAEEEDGAEVDGQATATGTDPGLPDAPALDVGDVDLGLRYLTQIDVLVLAEASQPEIVKVVADAARWGEATLLLVVGPGMTVPDDLPPDAIVFEAPETDPDGVFAEFVGSFAAALDDGTEPGAAFRAAIVSDGWTEATKD